MDFYKTSISHEEHKIALFIKNNTDFYDVVYSPDYKEEPPHMYLKNEMPQDLYLYYELSRKWIYHVSSFDEIPVTDLPDKAVINIFISDETLNDEAWRKLKNENYYPQQVNNYYLFKFSKKDYQSLISRYQENNNPLYR
ncbi:MAG TPA: hypothetical protein PKW80_12535 [Bacteroidales bacterium]|nr:hypothetical protein [Bacteroidales bacterium]